MRLIKFRVTEFRSVEDSGWIDTGRVTTLVGANESGKTNLMKALWKLNAGGEERIDPVVDMPRQKYYSLIAAPVKPVFITGAFRLTEEEIRTVNGLAGFGSSVRYVYVGRDYDDRLHYEFAEEETDVEVAESLIRMAQDAAAELDCPASAVVTEEMAQLRAAVGKALTELTVPTQASLAATVHLIHSYLTPFVHTELSPYPAVYRFVTVLARRDSVLSLGLNADVQAYVKERLPIFLFYASSGNLDGEIYLPQMCDNLHRGNLRGHEIDRARTARKFFSLLERTPEEMLELGRSILDALNDENELQKFLTLKEQAESILNAAEAKFNRIFNEWTGGCNFLFDFKLDGDYLRIRVQDEGSLEPIELEHRSEWIQWMFSFCVNLIGSKDGERVLLLDEPELALHPLSQVDLRTLLDEKSRRSQVVFCTHSPFFIDNRHLERVINVFDDERGYTVTGEDLRISSRAAQIEAGFALSSAVTIGVSDGLMKGCIPVLCETVSDQICLATFKNLLASLGELRTRREFVFIPCGGLAGVKAVLPLLVGKNNFLPAFVAGGDRAEVVNEIIQKASVFDKHPDRAITVGAESASRLEDLFPRKVYAAAFGAYAAELGIAAGVFASEGSIVGEIERFAKERKLTLPADWREETAQLAKQELIRCGARLYSEERAKFETIRVLFDQLIKL